MDWIWDLTLHSTYLFHADTNTIGSVLFHVVQKRRKSPAQNKSHNSFLLHSTRTFYVHIRISSMDILNNLFFSYKQHSFCDRPFTPILWFLSCFAYLSHILECHEQLWPFLFIVLILLLATDWLFSEGWLTLVIIM